MSHQGGELILLGWEQETLSLAHLLPGAAAVPGPAAPYRWPESPGWVRAALSSEGRWRPTSAPNEGRARRDFLLLPLEEQITLVAGLSERGRLERLRALTLPISEQGGALPVAPSLPEVSLGRPFSFEVLRGPPLRFRVELTARGLRTGILLGEGLLRPPAAATVPRPEGAIEGLRENPEWGLLLELRTASPPPSLSFDAATPIAEATLHLPASRAPLSLEWPAAPSVTPALQGLLQPGRAALTAAPMLRWATPSGEDEQAPLRWLSLSLEALGACEAGSVTFIARVEDGALKLPAHPLVERLAAAPLLLASLSFVFDESLSFSALSEPALAQEATPRQRAGQFSVGWRGFWAPRQPEGGCDRALGGIARPEQPRCVDGELLRYRVDGCGAELPLPFKPFSVLSCLPRGVVPHPEAPESEPAATPSAPLTGGWFRGELRGELGELLWSGLAGEGPWLWIDDAGRVASLAPALRWRGALERWEPLEGRGRLSIEGCRLGAQDVTLERLDGGSLSVRGRYLSGERWTLRFWRE